MRNYIKADLYRIIHKKRRWIILAISCLLFAFTCVKKAANLFEAMDNLSMPLLGFSLIIGIMEITYVYGDDFKAKTMQIAIGSGVARQKVIHAKWLEFMIVIAFDLAVFGLTCLVFGLAWVGSTGGFDVRAFLITLIMEWVNMVVDLGCVMFIMFQTQGVGMAMLVYLILYLGSLISSLLDMLLNALRLERLHIQDYFLQNMIDTLTARLILGHFSWFNAIGILIYMMVGFALASILFRKKELEF